MDHVCRFLIIANAQYYKQIVKKNELETLRIDVRKWVEKFQIIFKQKIHLVNQIAHWVQSNI